MVVATTRMSSTDAETPTMVYTVPTKVSNAESAVF